MKLHNQNHNELHVELGQDRQIIDDNHFQKETYEYGYPAYITLLSIMNYTLNSSGHFYYNFAEFQLVQL